MTLPPQSWCRHFLPMSVIFLHFTGLSNKGLSRTTRLHLKMQTGSSISYSPRSRLAAHWLRRTTCKVISNVCFLFRDIQCAWLNPSKVFLHVQSDEEAALFESQLSTVVALTKGCKSAKVVRDFSEIPEGCGSSVVTPKVAVHILVRVSNLFLVVNVELMLPGRGGSQH